MTRGSFGKSVVYINTSLCSPFYCSNPPYLCFCFIAKWYTHTWSYFKHDTYFFALRGEVYNIRILSVVDEVYNMVSTRIKPFLITSFRFFYTWIWSLYSRCSNGLFAICGVLCIKGVLKGPQNDHKPFNVCKSSSHFCDVFVLLCLPIGLRITYYISITKYFGTLHWA
jgi:hypothetical protein